MSEFRKLNVDLDDEDLFVDEGLCSPLAPAELETLVKERARQVSSLVSRGNLAEALQKALETPPFGQDAASVKVLLPQTPNR